jgi:hypothetical protein
MLSVGDVSKENRMTKTYLKSWNVMSLLVLHLGCQGFPFGLGLPSKEEAEKAVNKGLDMAAAFDGTPRCYSQFELGEVSARNEKGEACAAVPFREVGDWVRGEAACKVTLDSGLTAPKMQRSGTAIMCKKDGVWAWKRFER